MFALSGPPCYGPLIQTPVRGWSVTDNNLTERQLAILKVIEEHMRTRGYPPSVREIGSEGGLPSTSHRPCPLRHPPAPRVPAPRPHQAARHRGPLRRRVGIDGRAPSRPPRPAR